MRPYYLFHCDPVTGAGHFRTSVWKGMEIMEGLRGHMSGLGVPTYVVDGPHGGGKIPLMPNYLVSASDDAVVLRNYEGMIFRYAPEDQAQPHEEKYDSLGVSSLLGGQAKPLVPEGNRRLARRKPAAVPVVDVPAPVVPEVPQVANGAAAHSDLLPIISAAGSDGVHPTSVQGAKAAKPQAKTNGKTNGHKPAATNGHKPANGNGHKPANGMKRTNGTHTSEVNGNGTTNGANGSKSAGPRPPTVPARSPRSDATASRLPTAAPRRALPADRSPETGAAA